MRYTEYIELVKVIADSDKTEFERGEIVIKDMSKVISDILDYKYAAENYKGDAEGVLDDKINSIKNSVARLESDLDVYKERMGISKKVAQKKEDRAAKIVELIS